MAPSSQHRSGREIDSSHFVSKVISMNDLFWIAPVALAILGAVFAAYSVSTRGIKGAQFGDRIALSDTRVIEYRLRGARHSIRLHKMGTDELYGLEVGRWLAVFGETSPILIPRENLLQLRDQITQFVDATGVEDAVANGDTA